jgi:hypothetical protein
MKEFEVRMQNEIKEEIIKAKSKTKELNPNEDNNKYFE